MLLLQKHSLEVCFAQVQTHRGWCRMSADRWHCVSLARTDKPDSTGARDNANARGSAGGTTGSKSGRESDSPGRKRHSAERRERATKPRQAAE